MVQDQALTIIGHRLRVDSWTAEAVVALRERGIRALLLKGPAIACWLYPDEPYARPYTDVDLLVAPQHREPAGEALKALGYEMHGPLALLIDEPHARHFHRLNDGAMVDLHRVIHCTEHISTEHVWNLLSAGTENMEVAGVEVEVPNLAIRSLHIVLHLAPYDGPRSQPWRDLQRALRVVDAPTWRRAAQIACSLGIAGDFRVRLERLSQAHELVHTLALPRDEPTAPAFLPPGAAVAVPGVGSLTRLAALQGRGAQFAYLRAKLFPPAAFLLERQGTADSHRLAIPRARMAWLARCVVGLPRALRQWRRLSSRC